MASKYWRTVEEKTLFDDYHGEFTIFSFQCINCKVEWECDKSPEAFKLCPFCEVRWRGEFTIRKPKYLVPDNKLPAFVVQHLKGRPFDSLKDVWCDYNEEIIFLEQASSWAIQLVRHTIDMKRQRHSMYRDVKKIRLIVRYPDDSIKVLKEFEAE